MANAAYYPRAVVILKVLIETFEADAQDAFTFLVVPRKVEIKRNHHRAADEARVELDGGDFPLDPRVIRAAFVEIHLGDAGENDGDLRISEGGAASTLAFVGVVDTPEIRLDDDRGVTLSCRDQTAFFLDSRWPGHAIDIDRPLADVIETIQRATPGAASITVEYSQGAGEVHLSRALGKAKYSPQPDDDAWTVIVDLCGRAGLVPVIDGPVLRVATAADVGRRDVSFAYGGNLSSLVYRRKMNERQAKQIEVVCWDPDARQSRTAKWPRTPLITQRKVSKDGKTSETAAPLVRWAVTGPYTDAQLEAVARMVYEDAARDQLDGELRTKDMRDLDGLPLWLLANGDKLRVRIAAGALAELAARSDTSAAQLLTERLGIAPAAAAALASAQRKAEILATAWYAREVTHTWSRDDGYELQARFISYIER